MGYQQDFPYIGIIRISMRQWFVIDGISLFESSKRREKGKEAT